MNHKSPNAPRLPWRESPRAWLAFVLITLVAGALIVMSAFAPV